jgi:hypothetical protein
MRAPGKTGAPGKTETSGGTVRYLWLRRRRRIIQVGFEG